MLSSYVCSYNEENAELEALQEKFDEQDEEYTVLMAEKEEVETRIFQEKAFKFLMNRSARRIQRCWRAYRERKALRKKSKKGLVHYSYTYYPKAVQYIRISAISTKFKVPNKQYKELLVVGPCRTKKRYMFCILTAL